MRERCAGPVHHQTGDAVQKRPLIFVLSYFSILFLTPSPAASLPAAVQKPNHNRHSHN